VVAGAAVAVAALGRDRSDRETSIVQQKPAAVEVSVTGASTAQRRLLRAILTRIGPVGIRKVELGPAGRVWRPAPADAVAMRVTTRHRNDVRGAWEAHLLAGAFQEESLQLKLPPVVAVSANGGGSRLFGLTWPPRRSGARLTARDARTLARDIGAAASGAGAAATRITLLRPSGFAFAVLVRAPEPAAFLRRGVGDLLRLGGPVMTSDGAYVEVRDREGRFAAAISIANLRAGTMESSHARPELVGCLARAGRRFGHAPPPCPEG
jgi:hypothetical protein